MELSKITSGLSIKELIEEIKKHKLLGEFFNRERMKEQEPTEREQLSHTKNKEAIEETLYPKVVEALITPNTKGINLESLGLMNFILPNIETVELNDRFELNFTKYIDKIKEQKNSILNLFQYNPNI